MNTTKDSISLIKIKRNEITSSQGTTFLFLNSKLLVYITGTRSNADIADMKSLQNKERPIDIHSKKHKEK